MLEVARARIGDRGLRSEANLRRATSDLYYTMFHALCEALVEPLAVRPDDPAFVEIYTHLYRQPNHGYAEQRCKSVAQGKSYSKEIKRFATHFVTMKNKRELADYHPLEKLDISVVRNDLELTETNYEHFWTTDSAERISFACHVGLRKS